jgi:hypothetical protein
VNRTAHPREQGDLGEVAAIEWLTRNVGPVFIPVTHSPDFDLIVAAPRGLLRVEVKTSTCVRGARYEVAVCTRGGNQSWNGVTKTWEPSRCDYLFVLVGDERRWFIPSCAIEAKRAICLGGPKYSEFEVTSRSIQPSRFA